MSIVRQRDYTPADVEAICRISEFRPTHFESGGQGHTFTKHIGVSNAQMTERGETLLRKGKKPIVAVTSFITNADAFKAGAELLNSKAAKTALGAFDSGHTGMRASVTHFQTVPTQVRYFSGGLIIKTMPSHWYRMIVDRNEVAPYGLLLVSFFPLLGEDPSEGAAVTTKSGRPWKRPPA